MVFYEKLRFWLERKQMWKDTNDYKHLILKTG